MSLNDELKDNDLKSMELTDDALEGVSGGNCRQTFSCINCGIELTGDAGRKTMYWLTCKCGKRYYIDRWHWTVTAIGGAVVDNVRWWD